MNNPVTSKEEILEVCKDIVSKEGIQALNMRKVASNSNIALGSLYNYFSNKNDLVFETIESVWKDIFNLYPNEENTSFINYIEYIFNNIQKGIKKYPNFFNAHSFSIAQNKRGIARKSMMEYFSCIKDEIMKAMYLDKNIKENKFSNDFTRKAYSEFIFDNILFLLLAQKKDCKVLIETINRTLY